MKILNTRRIGCAITTNTSALQRTAAAVELLAKYGGPTATSEFNHSQRTCTSGRIHRSLRPRLRRQFGRDGSFLPLDVLRNGNARRLDDVHDVDANARPDLVWVGPELPFYVAGNDGGDDVAIRTAHFFETETDASLVVRYGNRLLRGLDGARGRNLRAWCRIRSGGHAVGSFHFPQLLEPGAHRMFIVDWPAAQSWRANVEYRKVLEGFAALESKARIAWATRTLSYWTGLVHVAVGHVASDEVQDLSRTNHSSQPPPATPP